MFNAENQDGRKKWRENDFKEKLPVDSAVQNFRRNRSISLYFRDKRIFAFNAENQDGRKNGGKTILEESC